MTSRLLWQVLATLLALSLSLVVLAKSNIQSDEASQMRAFADRLIAATTEEDRKGLLATNKELITIELRKELVKRGEGLRVKSNYPQALAVFALAQQVAEQLNDQAGLGAVWNGVGFVYFLQGNYQQALGCYEKSLALCQSAGDKGCQANSLAGFGNVSLWRGDYARATEYFQQEFTVSQESGDQGKVAVALTNLGVAQQNQGNYTRALDYHQRSQKVFESVGDKTNLAAVLNRIGNINVLRGELELAMQYYEKCIALYQETGNRAGVANGFNNIGVVNRMRGDYGSAIKYYEKGLTVNEALGNRAGVANAYTNIGIVYRMQGNLALALEYQQKNLALREALGDKPGVASTLNNLGSIYSDLGDYARALEQHQKGLSVWQSIGNNVGVARALNNIGNVHQLQGAYDLALQDYSQALKISEESGEKEQIVSLLQSMGASYALKGDQTRAAELAERSVASAKASGYREYLWKALTIAGNAYRALGQGERARAQYDEAILIVEALRQQVAGGEQEQQGYFAALTSPYYKMVALLAEQGKPNEALAYAERAKARVLMDVLQSGRANVTKAMTEQEKDQEGTIRQTLNLLNTQLARENRNAKPDGTHLAQLNAQLAKARLEQQDFQTRLYVAHPELKVRRGEATPYNAAQSSDLLTDARTAFLEYVVTDDTTFLFVLTANAATRNRRPEPVLQLYDLKIKRSELASRVEKNNQRIANNDLDYTELSAELYNSLLTPARAQLQGKTHFVIVPDDKLWETPFQALRTRDGRFLIQEAAISYAPSLTVLREIIHSRKPKSASTLLALGNPKLDEQAVSRSKNVLMGGGFEPLPEAERLVKELAQVYGMKASKIYVGAEAREDLLKAEATNYQVLQLATHGILNNASPMYSHVVLSQSADGKEDGLLEAWEIMQLDLQADLAVLSACETARGKISAGEGVIGLSWALFVAGCPTTVVSQWKVESASTADLMLAFHRNLQAGTGKGEAMRQAALKVMANKRYAHPFYWAGFIVVGDGN